MVKSTSSNDQSWASIVKKSLKMSFPEVGSDMAFSENGNSIPEVSFSRNSRRKRMNAN